jgi:hypothetical protein
MDLHRLSPAVRYHARMKPTWIALGVVSVVVLAGCSSKPAGSLVGKWRKQVMPGDAEIVRVFNSDNTYVHWCKGKKLLFKAQGTYRLESGELVTTQKEIVFADGRVDKKRVETRLNVQWLSSDKVKLSLLAGGDDVFEREK